MAKGKKTKKPKAPHCKVLKDANGVERESLIIEMKDDRGQRHLYLVGAVLSDAALAFAWLHVARREGLCDRAFIDAHTLGWDELEPRLDACTPAWGEATTGVPAAAAISIPLFTVAP